MLVDWEAADTDADGASADGAPDAVCNATSAARAGTRRGRWGAVAWRSSSSRAMMSRRER